MMQRTIKDIKALLETIDSENHPLLKSLETDSRKGVQLALRKWKKQYHETQLLMQSFKDKNVYENELYQSGARFVAGVDEVGRGPLAGPVVAACVILDPKCPIFGLNDSKQLSLKKREQLVNEIQQKAIAVSIGQATVKEIDSYNIYQATRLAMLRAVETITQPIDHLLIDAMTIDSAIPQQHIIKGDVKSNSIAAASIVAKQYRDRLMQSYATQFPWYDFERNMGYGTPSHLAGIEHHGICCIHRKTFEPIKSIVKNKHI